VLSVLSERSDLEHQPRLKLKHARRIDVAHSFILLAYRDLTLEISPEVENYYQRS